MKKKITALCICIAMLAIALIGGTMAYFTDKEEKTNVFTVGNIDIELNEVAKVLDKDGKELNDKMTLTATGVEYNNLMPTNKIVKEPVVVNTGSNAAYVRVTVDMNNADKLNLAIDEVYEKLGKSAEEVQAVYNNVFVGWGINYNPRPSKDGKDDARGVIDGRADGTKLIAVDFTKTTGLGSTTYLYGRNNMFMAGVETPDSYASAWAKDNNATGYYSKTMDKYQIRYAFYLYLKPSESFTLFEGLNVPSDFDNNRDVNGTKINQMDFFKDLTIEITADAIQAEGFNDAREAFEALEAAHPMS